MVTLRRKCRACQHTFKHHKQSGRCTRKCGCVKLPTKYGEVWAIPDKPGGIMHGRRPFREAEKTA